MKSWQALEGGPLMIVIGEVLLVVCSLSYLVWWTITFRPSVRTAPGGGLFLAGAVLAGFGGLVLLAVGIAALLPKASLLALGATIVGGGLVGALLSCVAALLNTLPMLLRSTSRIAIKPTATSAMIRAYSTSPCPVSSLQNACHNVRI